jgi:hypothetical protein
MYAQILRRVVAAARIGKQLLGAAALLVLGVASVLKAQDTAVVYVRSDSGKAVIGAVVDIPTLDPTNKTGPVLASTDSSGVARLAPVPPASFTLRARAIGFQAARQVVTWTPGTPITIELVKSPIQLTEVCLTNSVPGILLWLDSAIVCGTARLTVRVRNGESEEKRVVELPAQWPNQAFAYEAPGTNDIEVTARGYERWHRSDIRVTRDWCHVITQSVHVRLVRSK